MLTCCIYLNLFLDCILIQLLISLVISQIHDALINATLLYVLIFDQAQFPSLFFANDYFKFYYL